MTTATLVNVGPVLEALADERAPRDVAQLLEDLAADLRRTPGHWSRNLPVAPSAGPPTLQDLAEKIAAVIASHPAAWQLIHGPWSDDGHVLCNILPGGASGFVAQVLIADDGASGTVHGDASAPLACPCHGAAPPAPARRTRRTA